MLPGRVRVKVGLIACSGEALPLGTVTRLAVRRVLETLRPEDTVTICLPLFLAGEERERGFARKFPTITIDGCEKRCAALATAKYSATPAASIVLPDLLAERGLAPPRELRAADEAGRRAIDETAAAIAEQVDRLLAGERPE